MPKLRVGGYIFMFFGNKSKDRKLEGLYNKYKNLMFYVANNILKDEFLAEDVVHKSFIKIYVGTYL